MTPSDSDFRISMSSVPGSRSWRPVVFFPIDWLWSIARELVACSSQFAVCGRRRHWGPPACRIHGMRRLTVVLVLAVVYPVLAFAASGPLIIVGGGGTGPEIVSKALELAGGANAIVAVLPQASAEPDAGDSSVKMWIDAGA